MQSTTAYLEASLGDTWPLVLAATLALSKLPLHILRKIWFEPLGVASVRTHTGGEAKAWLRRQGGFVVVAGDNETYRRAWCGICR